MYILEPEILFPKDTGISESEVKNYLIEKNNGMYPLQKKYKEVKDSLNTY
jgi:hypothetical protein